MTPRDHKIAEMNSNQATSSSGIQVSFDKSLIDTSIVDVSIDIADASIDELMSSDLIKEIPIVKTIAALIKTGANIQDRLFLKKILAFLQNLDQISEEDRKKVIQDIDNSKKYGVKVGEKLLYIIDSCVDHTHAENVSKLFSAMVKGKITYQQYIDAAQIISRISRDELEQFLNAYTDIHYLDDNASSLSHTGLIYTETTEVDVEIEKIEQGNWKDPPEHYEARTHGGNTIIYSSRSGDTIFEVFGIGKKALEKQNRAEHETKKIRLQETIIGTGGNKK